tara:strand:+ start:8052 stop:9608 length:1557 start_codon:yes stop_codon:yes gene_type:complete
MDQALKKEDIPAGGIADFVMTDEQIELLEAEELKEQYGTGGIAQFSDVGKKMANFGRYGDDTVAHVETGELIVPRALIDRSPALKESIFQHLRELGVEDPERYVVGSQENSINPTTGLPEFFLKKLFKKVSRGVSSIAKSVGKALKKAAPVILPLALAATPLGPIYGAALGSGIGTLISGGSTEDALRNAVLAGASGAVYSGIRGGTAGISQAFADPAGRFGQTATGISEGNFFGRYQAPVSEIQTAELKKMLPEGRNLSAKIKEKDVLSNLGSKTGSNIALDPKEAVNLDLGASVDRVGAIESLKQGEYFDAFTGGPKVSAADVARANNIDITKLKTTDALYQELVKKAAELSPGFMGTYGPSLALAGTVGASTGFFDAPEQEELKPARTGLDVYQEDPDRFKVGDTTVNQAQGPFTTDTSFGFQYNPYVFPKNPFDPPVFTQNVAEGGEIFPRRTGGIMPDEGIPNEDSVRAMLMPGEFVMTTDAVRGLGNGNLNKGINNMYSVMRNLEQRGRAMA